MEYGIGIRTNMDITMKDAFQDIGEVMGCLMERKFVLDHLYIGLQKNSRDMIVKKPTHFDGIECYLYVYYKTVGMFEKTAKIGIAMLKELEIGWDEAWSRAEKNTFSEIRVESIFSMIGMEDFEPDDLYVPMLIVTNKKGYRGASSILDENTIRKIATRFETKKLVMLPSSIHECIVIPYDEAVSMEKLNDMVRSVNSSDVEPEDILSDKAYILEI